MKVSKVSQRRRLLWSLLLLLLMFSALIVRLAYVQIGQGAELSAKAEELWRRDIPFAAKRGEILDRNGTALVTSITTPTIWAIPVQIKDADHTARTLAPLLGMNEADVKKVLRNVRE